MSNINLLPWREEHKKKKKNAFFVVLLLSSMFVLGLSYVGKIYIDSMISAQKQRNQYLQTQTIILDRRIAEIRNIKKEKAELERRIKLIQKLEEKRNYATRLFNTLAEHVPGGVYLKTITFNAEKVVVQGDAESNNRVTRMMRNIDGSGWLGDSYLRNIKEGPRKPIKLYNFGMDFRVVPEKKGAK
ncbi:pilus assembly protein PilN [Psychromonas sp. psych-6C06]|uniref:PilN domain-containing protein n=1 Tax=Psychromonas sp. psych-6C06 TaxID=2058089 RepID=UPI000C31CE7B|nr:PilN domain-containing protein [Psychromonas sp. psych-6C06]PKF61480.1 pilus assembly protein PilN [Psychromonas sp. psych-6C06]